MIFAEIIIGLNEISYSFLYENNYTFPTILYKSRPFILIELIKLFPWI